MLGGLRNLASCFGMIGVDALERRLGHRVLAGVFEVQVGDVDTLLADALLAAVMVLDGVDEVSSCCREVHQRLLNCHCVSVQSERIGKCLKPWSWLRVWRHCGVLSA